MSVIFRITSKTGFTFSLPLFFKGTSASHLVPPEQNSASKAVPGPRAEAPAPPLRGTPRAPPAQDPPRSSQRCSLPS